MTLVPITPSSIDTADPVGHVLALCEQGARALGEAQSVSEAKHVMAMTQTIEAATKTLDLAGEAATAASSLRVAAERRVGQLMAAERDAGTLKKGPGRRRLAPVGIVDRPDNSSRPATLADHGISRDQAADYARLAAVPDQEFEKALESVKSDAKPSGTNVTRAAVLRAAQPDASRRPDERWLEADRFVTSCKTVNDRAEAAVSAMRFGLYPSETELVRDGVVRVLTKARDHIDQALRAMERAK